MPFRTVPSDYLTVGEIMKNSFLTGSFLASRAKAYHFKNTHKPEAAPFNRQQLERRFARRAERFERRKGGYSLTLQASAIGACLALIGVLNLPLYQQDTFEIQFVQQELVEMEEIVQTAQQLTPPLPPRPPVPVEVPNDEVLENDVLDLDASLDINEPLAALPPPPPPVEEETEDELEIFVVVEEMPEMIGGMAALIKDLQYPRLAQQANIEGMVVVQVVVNEEGEPLNPVVARSGSELLDKAAIAAVMKQRFKPGMQRGRAVKVQIAIPVRFQLTT